MVTQKGMMPPKKVNASLLCCDDMPESNKLRSMMNTQEIERAIVQPPSSEIAKLAGWFREFQAQAWDQQLERDVQAGRLDALVEQAESDFQAGRCQEL